jgi:hypothetical protein
MAVLILWDAVAVFPHLLVADQVLMSVSPTVEVVIVTVRALPSPSMAVTVAGAGTVGA